jgi:hypothetical protein
LKSSAPGRQTLTTLAAALLLSAGGGSLSAQSKPTPRVSTRAARPTDPALQRELITRASRDQQQMCLQAQDMSDSSRVRTLRATLRANGAWLDTVIAEHRWPTVRMVGEKGVNAAWLIAQHADELPDMQQRALTAIREALSRGEARARDMAFLDDRIRKAQGRAQYYGTQVAYDSAGTAIVPAVEDAQHLDDRRRDVGLPPMREYLEQMRAMNAQLRAMPAPATTPTSAARSAIEKRTCAFGL